jgi:hypothetical protein
MKLGLTQPLTEISIRNISWGQRWPVRRADNLTTFICRLSWNLGASTSCNPQGLSRPVIYLFWPSANEAGHGDHITTRHINNSNLLFCSTHSILIVFLKLQWPVVSLPFKLRILVAKINSHTITLTVVNQLQIRAQTCLFIPE